MKYKIEKSVILDFISGFKEKYEEQIVKLFTEDYSYYFATILNDRFSKAGYIMILPEEKQFYYKLFGKVYDITGEISDANILEKLILWDLYLMKYNEEGMKIFKEDILKLSEEEE